MEVGTTTRTVISTAQKQKKGIRTAQVVYKTYEGKHKGKARYSSKTRHEKI